jgi:serine/threonine protein kinase
MIDFYSLGAVLYEFVMGAPPFYSANQNQMFEEILSGEVTRDDLEGVSR